LRAVVDTNVVAYLLLGTEPFAEEARALFAKLKEAQAPAIWEAELANVLWMAARQKVVTVEGAAERLTLAESLGIHSVPNRALWKGALVRAHQSGVAVYDSLFVELAVREGLKLATFNRGLLKAFPGTAVRPGVEVTGGGKRSI
jgi:predicted nucleic acid-binding protein